jgi:hypothetical protein
MHADKERQLAEDFVLTEGDGIEESKENTEDGDGDDFVEIRQGDSMELKAWKVCNAIHDIPSLHALIGIPSLQSLFPCSTLSPFV